MIAAFTFGTLRARRAVLPVATIGALFHSKPPCTRFLRRLARFDAGGVGLRDPQRAAIRNSVTLGVRLVRFEHTAIDHDWERECTETLDLIAAYERQRKRAGAVVFDLDVIESESINAVTTIAAVGAIPTLLPVGSGYTRLAVSTGNPDLTLLAAFAGRALFAARASVTLFAGRALRTDRARLTFFATEPDLALRTAFAVGAFFPSWPGRSLRAYRALITLLAWCAGFADVTFFTTRSDVALGASVAGITLLALWTLWTLWTCGTVSTLFPSFTGIAFLATRADLTSRARLTGVTFFSRHARRAWFSGTTCLSALTRLALLTRRSDVTLRTTVAGVTLRTLWPGGTGLAGGACLTAWPDVALLAAITPVAFFTAETLRARLARDAALTRLALLTTRSDVAPFATFAGGTFFTWGTDVTAIALLAWHALGAICAVADRALFERRQPFPDLRESAGELANLTGDKLTRRGREIVRNLLEVFERHAASLSWKRFVNALPASASSGSASAFGDLGGGESVGFSNGSSLASRLASASSE